MTFLRFLMLLSLIVWLGGLVFFAFVLAPTVFSVLPTKHMAGSVVNRSLGTLHWMGIISAAIFLITSMLHAKLAGRRVFGAHQTLIVLMLALTMVSQFGIMPRMTTLRATIGEIDSVPSTDPAKVRFDALHQWSTRVEGSVLLLGLLVVYLTAASA